MSGEGDTQCDCNKQESLHETCENGSNVETYFEDGMRSVMTKLNNVYEERITDIDREATGDYKLKCLTYKEWIEVLQSAMKDMVISLEELETEAVDRICLLEKKLEHEKQHGHQYSIENSRTDIKQFVKLIKKNINKGVWNSMDCDFLKNNLIDLLLGKMEKKNKNGNNFSVDNIADNTKRNSYDMSTNDMSDHLNEEHNDDELLKHVDQDYIKNQTHKCPLDNAQDGELKLRIKKLNDSLKEKDEKIIQLEKENECLKSELGQNKSQSIERDKAVTSQRALAFEVAEKHDQIQEMRTQIVSLEEELKRAHKKVQFKDNVIRDLRRECKTFAKAGDIERIIPTRAYSSLIFEEESNSLRSEFSDYSDAMSRGTDVSLDSIIDNKADMIRALQMEEADCTKILNKHIDEIFDFQNTRNEAIEDRNNMLSAQQKIFRNLIRSLTRELAKTQKKFASISEKLGLFLGTDAADDSIMDENRRSAYSNTDSESELIDVIRVRIENLKDENLKLKSQLEYMAANTGTVPKEDKNKRIMEKTLRGIATIICNLRRKEEDVENLLTNPDNEQVVYPLCEAMANLATEILENSKNVDILKQTIADNKSFIDYLENQKNSLEQECSEKHNTITDLQQKVKNYEEALENLRQLNEEFQTELNLHKETAKLLELNTAEMLKAKIKLENETMYSERLITKLRDDNLCLRELIISSESDYDMLRKKYWDTKIQVYDSLAPPSYVPLGQSSEYLNASKNPISRQSTDQDEENFLHNQIRIIKSKMEKESNQRFQEQEQKYRDIIDDLTNELASLSDQVVMAQQEFNRDDMTSTFEESFRELESQNDFLQKTIERYETDIKKFETYRQARDIEIEQLKAKNASLNTMIDEKDAKYEEIQKQYKNVLQSLETFKIQCKCGIAQTLDYDGADGMYLGSRQPPLKHVFDMLDRKNEELKAFKEYSTDEKNRLTKVNLEIEEKFKQNEIKLSLLEKTLQSREKDLRDANIKLMGMVKKGDDTRFKEIADKLTQELAETKSTRKEREANLMSEVNSLRRTIDEQMKALSKNNDTIVNLERQAHGYRKHGDIVNKENAMLKAEIYKLKESLASQEGLERSLREQLKKTQDELQNIKQDLERATSSNDDIDALKQKHSRILDSYYELVKKYNHLVEDYNTLEEEYKKLTAIKEQLMNEVEITRVWQNDQKEQDRLVAAKITKLQEHINTLLEDRQNLIGKINELHRDAVIIGNELDHYKDVFTDPLRWIP